MRKQTVKKHYILNILDALKYTRPLLQASKTQAEASNNLNCQQGGDVYDRWCPNDAVSRPFAFKTRLQVSACYVQSALNLVPNVDALIEGTEKCSENPLNVFTTFTANGLAFPNHHSRFLLVREYG
ncbi:hypothetical protein NQ318_003403 [Aromia moschata]|uniref:Uncharacterized protein n=1 Tax=Aromia moschata TaxID=1265417 RepID=A0AAV8X4M7_9CUCU|nr:hypothetical protein NQ318_003403 [Aromia moschata]